MKEDYLMMPLKDKLQLLGRMKSDCEYYLGEGRKQITHLWGGTVDNQIRSMQELLSSILQEYRPEWLTLEDIRRFSDAMDHRQVITAETLGLSGARFITFESGSQQEPRRKDEIFFTIKKRAYTEKNGKKVFYVTRGEQGYITMTNGMENIFNTLFRDRRTTAAWNASNGMIPGTSCSKTGFTSHHVPVAWKNLNLRSGIEQFDQQHRKWRSA